MPLTLILDHAGPQPLRLKVQLSETKPIDRLARAFAKAYAKKYGSRPGALALDGQAPGARTAGDAFADGSAAPPARRPGPPFF